MNKCIHIQTLKGLEKTTLKKKRGWWGNIFQHISYVTHGIHCSLALESLAFKLAELLISVYKILST